MEFFLASLAIFTGCFFATISGFGFALISTPTLSMVLSAREAIIIVPLMTILLRLVTMYQVRKEFDPKTLFQITIGWCTGMLPGGYVLKLLPLSYLQIFLGTVILIAATLMGKKIYFEVKNWTLARFITGFAAGFFGTSTSVAGPPVVLYFLNAKATKEDMRSNMIWVFGFGNFITTVINIFMGNAKAIEDWNIIFFLVPAVLLAAYLGNLAFKRFDQELFRKMSLAIIYVGGVGTLFNGIKALF